MLSTIKSGGHLPFVCTCRCLNIKFRHLLSGLVEQRRPAVLCLHRENLPEVLAQVCAALGALAAVPADPALPKGGFWVAHVIKDGIGGAGELAALERYEP